MLLRSLSLENYGIFENAEFDLSTSADQPVVVITGNNGAGKTSLLEAIRLALHGRRGFDVPLSEAEYLKIMAGRFHDGNMNIPCSVGLTFDHVDNYATRTVDVRRQWKLRRSAIVEELVVSFDGVEQATADADDVLHAVVPPEIARYFFFDGERIRELADWDSDEENSLFTALADLLGIGLLDQLRSDLMRLSIDDDHAERREEDVAGQLELARQRLTESQARLGSEKALGRRIRNALDRARIAVRRIGVLNKNDLAAIQASLGVVLAERDALVDEMHRAAGDIMPLLCAKTLRSRFAKEIEAKRRLDEREIVNQFVSGHAIELGSELVKEGFRKSDARLALSVFERVVHGKPLPVGTSLQHISRNDGTWMERVISRELPEMALRTREAAKRLAKIEKEISSLESKARSAPKDDPVAEAALAEIEERQRTALIHETKLRALTIAVEEGRRAVEALEQNFKTQRLEAFRGGRLRLRGQLVNNAIDALPKLRAQIQRSKEDRFAFHLTDALKSLWHKDARLNRVTVSFADRRVSLFDERGEIQKRDLSAGEKQLFAVAFIYALARLSGRQMPFVIDTPLGRLDHEHRERLVNDFLPRASHQIILLSTDTEIVGDLYARLSPLIARRHELADHNGGQTQAVNLEIA